MLPVRHYFCAGENQTEKKLSTDFGNPRNPHRLSYELSHTLPNRSLLAFANAGYPSANHLIGLQ
jgi:hypothetical protein